MAAVIYLEVPEEELLKRGTGRRIHPASGRSYHMMFKPPKNEGKDDVTGEPLIQRDDDKEETIKARLLSFHKNNKEIIDFYEEQKVVHKIQGNDAIGKVWKAVDEVLEKMP